jgi:flagellar hook protein FlgE
MTISSSLNAGVAGLSSNASKLATISDNIANSSTYGYKRAQTDFQSMVMTGNSNSSYVAGGVRATTMRLIDMQGPLVNTTNATDIAIDGRGFLAVTDVTALADTTSAYPISLVTTGSFRADANGVLRTATGQVLMGWPADLLDGTSTFARDTLASLVPVTVGANQYVANPTTQISLSVNLPSTESVAGASGDPLSIGVEYFANLGESESLNFEYTANVPASGASNSWTMTVKDGAQSDLVVGVYTLDFNPDQTAGGTLLSVTTVSGASYDPVTGAIDVPVAGGTIALNIGKIGQIDGTTQLATGFTPVSIGKNGTPVASLSSMTVDEGGNLYAIYDQGFTRRLYQLPVVDVPNPNGLIAIDNQAYKLSVESGPIYLWNAGEGPTGSTLAFTREESSIDVATELVQLIQTQRAYSSNAKVIQAVALSLAVETDLPVEISDWVITMFLLMLFMVCSATIALLLVKIDDIVCFLRNLLALCAQRCDRHLRRLIRHSDRCIQIWSERATPLWDAGSRWL